VGLFGSSEDKNKAAGVNLNLWLAVALLLACGLFWLWASTRPLIDELEDEE
jgi:hypothetical protein